MSSRFLSYDCDQMLVFDAQLLADVAQRVVAALVIEGGIAAGHEQVIDLGQFVDQLPC